MRPRLELVDVTNKTPSEIPPPGGAISWEQVRFVTLIRNDETIQFVSAPGMGRVGVGTYQAGRHVSYRECSPAEAAEAVLGLELVGFRKVG